MAGSSPEILEKGLQYEKSGNLAQLDSLIKEGKIIRLKDNDKVDVIERSMEYRMLEIKFKNGDTYWVSADCVVPVRDKK